MITEILEAVVAHELRRIDVLHRELEAFDRFLRRAQVERAVDVAVEHGFNGFLIDRMETAAVVFVHGRHACGDTATVEIPLAVIEDSRAPGVLLCKAVEMLCCDRCHASAQPGR